MKYLTILLFTFLLTACHEGAFHWITPEPPLPTVEVVIMPTCEIKGNISGDGRKIYHTPESPNYDQTVIDDSAGELWFCTEEEAQAEGWTKAGN